MTPTGSAPTLTADPSSWTGERGQDSRSCRTWLQVRGRVYDVRDPGHGRFTRLTCTCLTGSV